MSTVVAIRLVMQREIHQRLHSRAFAVSTAFLCIGVLVAGVLNRQLGGDDGPQRYDVAVVGVAPAGFDEAALRAADALGIELQLSAAADRAAADQAVRNGDVDVAVDAGSAQLVSEHEPTAELATVISAAWQSAGSQQAAIDAGLDDAQVAHIVSPAPLDATILDPDDEGDDTVGNVVGFAAAVLLFISINAFGGMVLTGVVEEKTTGVVEVLLAHLRPFQLLAGKVFGIGAVAMVQLAAAVASGLIALRVSGATVPRAVWVGLPFTLLWFVCGFVLYSTLYALAGSCVSRQEDAQGAAAPISVVFTAAYITVFVLGSAPTSTAARVVSVLPPFAPLLMPLRVSVGAASVVEIVIAIVGLLLAMYGMLRLAGSVYGRTLLHRGSRLTWKQAVFSKGV